MRFSLRTLLIATAVIPPTAAGLWMVRNLTWRDVPPSMQEAMGISVCCGGVLLAAGLLWFSAVFVGWCLDRGPTGQAGGESGSLIHKVERSGLDWVVELGIIAAILIAALLLCFPPAPVFRS